MTPRIRCILVLALVSLIGAATTQPDLPTQLHSLVYSRPDPKGVSYPHMVDPPLWENTRHLLEGEPHQRALAIVDGILSAPVGESAREMRQRAILQHDLWDLFDWTLKTDEPQTRDARIALRERLAKAIRHVALTEEQIRALPSNLAGSDAPNLDLAEWVSLGNNGSEPIASVHLREFGGRSTFGVFIRHPQGPRDADAYIETLRKTTFPLPRDPGRVRSLIPGGAPDFPVGTRLALLRRMLLIDRNGKIVGSPIVQSVQTRTFLKIEPQVKPDHVKMEEFVLDRDAYVRGEAKSVRAMSAEEASPIVFLTHNVDPFEWHQRSPEVAYRPPSPTLSTCIACHGDPGILSMNSFTGAFVPPRAETNIAGLGFDREILVSRDWKESQMSWGVLRGYWEASR